MRASGTYDLVIVGAGSAGLTAARFAAAMGQRVALVERERLGGDCLWTGCVPSKALIAAARAASAMRHADELGLPAVHPQIDLASVWRRIAAVQHEIAGADDSPERLRSEGVHVLFGAARLLAGDRVQVQDHGVLVTKRILVATGSRPAIPSMPGLAEAGPLTTQTLWDRPQPPASLVIVGGGPIAIELAQALVRLGVAVTVLEREDTVLARDEPSLVAPLVARLRADGVVLHTGAQVTGVTVDDGPPLHGDERTVVHALVGGRPLAVRAEAVLVATGRAPNVEALGLEELGVQLGPRGIVVDDGYRTSARTVWAAGDVAGRHLFTHAAGFEATRAVRNMLFPGTDSGPFTVPWCTFTEPELAHAGVTETQARAEHGDRAVRVWRRELRDSDRARADGTADGAVLLVTAKGRLVGGHVLAPAAGEVVHELALAIHQRLRLADLASVVHVYPTIALAIQQLAADAAYGRARRWRWLIR